MARNPSVAEAFAGKTVLLTGASGFVGKAVLEKLLRTCPGIRRVYAVLRSRKGTPPQERLLDVLRDPAFRALKESDPDALDKVVAVAGDCAEPGLGIAAQERARLCAEVQVLVHAAASVRFDEPVRQAVLLNTRGAHEVAALATEMRSLEVLVHVSTTYCHTDKPVVEEQVYAPEADWRRVLRAAEGCGEESPGALDMGYHPNSYTFSKALAEQVMHDHADKLNIAIVRPAIVVAAVREPLPGWLSQLSGPLALCVGITKGLVHTTLVNEQAVADFVPLEVAVNGIVLAAHEGICRGKAQDNGVVGLRVYNGSAANKKTFSIGELIRCAVSASEADPHDRILWQPFVVATSSRLLFTLLSVLLHFIPALFMDVCLRLTGKRPWMVRTYSKIYKATLALQYFTTNQWVFKNDKFYDLHRNLSEEDRCTYQLDFSDISEAEYLQDTMRYIRRHVLRENMDQKKARRNQRMMYLLDRVVRGVLLYFLCCLIYRTTSLLLHI